VTNAVEASAAVLGLAASAVMTYTKLSGDYRLCRGFMGCEAVSRSPEARLFLIPNSVWGLGFYSASLVAQSLAQARSLSLRRFGYMISVIASAYLVYLQLYRIKAICPYCMASAAADVALLASTLVRPNR
jgi:uncharacterized membrane protein